MKKILMVTIPLYLISIALTQVDFNLLWRYFNWANQVTAVIALLVSTRYLFLKGRNYFVTFIPCIFMLYACVVYILAEPIGFPLRFRNIDLCTSNSLNCFAMVVLFSKTGKTQKANLTPR